MPLPFHCFDLILCKFSITKGLTCSRLSKEIIYMFHMCNHSKPRDTNIFTLPLMSNIVVRH